MAYHCIECNREQRYVMPPRRREWLPEHHLAWVIVDAMRGDAVAVRTSAELKRVATIADPVAIVIDVGDIARHLGTRTNRRFRLPKPRA